MNTGRITQTANTIAKLMGFSMPIDADAPNDTVINKAKSILGGNSLERVLLYNPDAIALWLYEKYIECFSSISDFCDIMLAVHSVCPSVTPVCFASMYTGLVPKEHGICTYTKPVLKVPTLFDLAIENGKKPIIISTAGDSISEIFKERKMDYIFCNTPDECNENALEIIKADKHDLIIVYNGNYDATMHKFGPEAPESLLALEHNIKSYAILAQMADKVWLDKHHLTAFLTDHGCHEIDGNCGSHGLDMPEDMEVIHLYSFK